MKKLVLMLAILTVMSATSACGLGTLDSSKDDASSSSSSYNINGSSYSSSETSSEKNYLYEDFTAEEKAFIVEKTQTSVPFLPTDGYMLEEYAASYSHEGKNYTQTGIKYSSYGHTQEEFVSYKTYFVNFASSDSSIEEGVTWYSFDSEDGYSVKMAYYEANAVFVIDVYVYRVQISDVVGTTFTTFTDTEVALFNSYLGETIPFVENTEYYVEEYTYEEEVGLIFYTLGNTQEEFNAYLGAFSAYTDAGSAEDDNGVTWYYFDSENYYIDVAYYYSKKHETYVIEVYAYTLGVAQSNA